MTSVMVDIDQFDDDDLIEEMNYRGLKCDADFTKFSTQELVDELIRRKYSPSFCKSTLADIIAATETYQDSQKLDRIIESFSFTHSIR